MAKQVNIQQAPNTIGQPTVHFNKNDFEGTIWAQGYDIIIERAIKCPCKSKGTDNLSNCQNCGGSGWVFINPVQTKAIIHSQNQTTKYKEWSEEQVGNANITVRDIDRLGFMDRITLLRGESIHTQTAYPVNYRNKLFSFLDYKPRYVYEVFMFHKHNEKLVLLSDESDYTIDDHKIILNNKFNNLENLTLSLRYIHSPQYHIIDVRRDVMVSTTYAVGEGKKKQQMPISAIGRRAHYVLDKQNFNNDYILDNSYQEDKCKKKVQIGNTCINVTAVTKTPTSSAKHSIIYNEQTQNFEYFNGINWVILGSYNLFEEVNL